MKPILTYYYITILQSSCYSGRKKVPSDVLFGMKHFFTEVVILAQTVLKRTLLHHDGDGVRGILHKRSANSAN